MTGTTNCAKFGAMNIPSTVTITDLRRRSAQLLKDLPEERLFLLMQNSQAKGAVVDLDYLKMLQQAYEDYLDILTYDQAIDEPRVSWKAYKRKSQSS